jgi:hypothetical protein
MPSNLPPDTTLKGQVVLLGELLTALRNYYETGGVFSVDEWDEVQVVAANIAAAVAALA